jgi:hypothetical protein
MTKQLLTLKVLTTITLACTTGCASAPPKTAAEQEPQPIHLSQSEIGDSRVDIAYELGRAQHRLTAEAGENKVTGRYLHDHSVLSEGEVDGTKYADFLQKALAFVQIPTRVPSSGEAPCHAPFTVTVRVLKDIKVSTGCRGADEGLFSHLVKDGEFLIYSKK